MLKSYFITDDLQGWKVETAFLDSCKRGLAVVDGNDGDPVYFARLLLAPAATGLLVTHQPGDLARVVVLGGSRGPAEQQNPKTA